YYLRARYYEPNIGRFTSRDPFPGFLTDPLSLAKYPYVHGNPVNHTDPSGLLKFDSQIAIAVHSILSSIPTVAPVGALRAAATVDSLVRINWIRALVVGGATASLAAVREFSRQNGIPTLVHAGGNLEEHARHIRDTQLFVGNTTRRVERLTEIQNNRVPVPDPIDASIERGRFISPRLVNPHPPDRGFYVPVRRLPDWGNRDFLGVLPVNSRLGGRLPQRVARDEFPFNSTVRGGEDGYNANRVSVRYVPQVESSRQGGLIRQFYRHPGVDLNNPTRANHPLRGRFVTLGLPFLRVQSGFFTRDGIFVGYTPVGR
ncbi:MAG: hypothetical protein F6K39_26585, partial [Okeania sp. SIO3B3]|nr:hypothetical protein [Okeania sp. SIO3B3]